jgi:Arc/MetJ-type ribon-helix-helix transcriptional regulator
MVASKKKLVQISLPEHLMDRVEKYLDSPGAFANSKRELFQKSVEDFLAKEELIAAKIEKEIARIRCTSL